MSEVVSAMRVLVEGRVQGVFFRDSTRARAVELGLRGWVRNLPDGRVEALFVGDRGACEAALSYVRVGPPHAKVRDVTHEWVDVPEGIGGRFEIRY